MTLRLRLTLLYGGCFLVAGIALLAITYGLVAQDAATHSGPLRVATTWLALPTRLPSGVGSGAATSARVTVHARDPAPGAQITPVSPTSGEVKQLQVSGQRQIDRVVEHANAVIGAQKTESLNALLTRSGMALGITALLSIGLGYLMAGRALSPLQTMNARARAISEDNLHQRLGFGERRDELGELAGTFDDLLARLERAFESQRRFVSNASHELRTPVTLERTLVEVALADPHATVDSLKATCRRVLAATEHQEHVIGALLTLARSQAGIEARESVDLAGLLTDGLAARQRQLVSFDLNSSLGSAPVRGDRLLLERMVANLLDNAVVHNAADDGWIRVRTDSAGAHSELRIANGGAVVSVQRAASLFEPFRRLDGERTGDGGLGLGLSIVKAIALAHGGRVDVTPIPAGGLEFRIALPAAPAAQGRARNLLAGASGCDVQAVTSALACSESKPLGCDPESTTFNAPVSPAAAKVS